MYYPTLKEVRQLKQYGNLVPVCRDIQADPETPVSAYLKIARGNYSFLLESVEGGERPARYSFKERAEGIMLVDLGRNDIGRISESGTVEVTQLMDVERYSHVMHLVSQVQGKLRAGLSPFSALRSCFPAGTVSGAPKIRAMEIIAELERDQRGPYAGAVGYFDFSGNLDTAIAIRTIVIKNNIAHIQAGAGLVADSIPEQEYQESLNKVQASLAAIDQAEADQYVSSCSLSS